MAEPTRAEHLAWCKVRALECAQAGALVDAVVSMGSDLAKHPGTLLGGSAPYLLMAGLIEAREGNAEGVRRWIEGFN